MRFCKIKFIIACKIWLRFIMKGKVVILGGGIAGISAKLVNRNAVLIDKSRYMIMAPCLIDVVSGYPEEHAMINRNVDIIDNIKNVDFKNKSIILDNNTVEYEKLIIALGPSQNYSFINGSEYVYGLSSLEGAIKIRERLKTSKDVIIIGGGYLGVEIAGAIKNKNITVIERAEKLLTGLPENLSTHAEKILREKHVKIIYGSTVKSVGKDSVITSDNEYNSDLTLFAGGLTGNKIIGNFDITNKNLKIVVDKYLKSVDYEDVYACGDSMFIENKGNIPMSAIIARSAGITAMHNALGYMREFRNDNWINVIEIGNNYFGTLNNSFINGGTAKFLKKAAIALSVNYARSV